jgi:hypothetical protein
VENGSWHTYAMHSVLPPKPGVTLISHKPSHALPSHMVIEGLAVNAIKAFSLRNLVTSAQTLLHIMQNLNIMST